MRQPMTVLLLLAGFIFQAAVACADTECPVDDFRAIRGKDVTDDTMLMMFEADLNGDGVKEVFLTREEDRNGRMGNIWMVYVSRGKQFHLGEQLPSFGPETLAKHRSTGSRIDRLFSVRSARKGELSISEFVISGADIAERAVAKIGSFTEEDADVILELLKGGSGESVAVRKGKPRELRECSPTPQGTE